MEFLCFRVWLSNLIIEVKTVEVSGSSPVLSNFQNFTDCINIGGLVRDKKGKYQDIIVRGGVYHLSRNVRLPKIREDVDKYNLVLLEIVLTLILVTFMPQKRNSLT